MPGPDFDNYPIDDVSAAAVHILDAFNDPAHFGLHHECCNVEYDYAPDELAAACRKYLDAYDRRADAELVAGDRPVSTDHYIDPYADPA